MIEPDAIDKERARKIHAMFATLPKAEHIASEFSLSHLSALQRKLQPTRILEIGAGIGTITCLLLYTNASVTAYERESEFRAELLRNIGLHERLRIISTLKDERGPFELIVVDGEIPKSGLRLFTPGTTVFVEGKRIKQRQQIGIEFTQLGPKPKGAYVGRVV